MPGCSGVQILASGGLNEDEIARLVTAAAPIDGFGVGSDMAVSRDAPGLDIVYKLVEYAGRPRLKLSPGKAVLSGRKQIFRVEESGLATHDVLGRRDESPLGRPLVERVMVEGRRNAHGRTTIDASRARARWELDRLPPRIRGLDPSEPSLQRRGERRVGARRATLSAPRARNANPLLTDTLGRRRIAATKTGGPPVPLR